MSYLKADPAQASHDSFEAPSRGPLTRAVAASAIGNVTEWFDYGIYSYGLTHISAALFHTAALRRRRCSRLPPSRSPFSCGRPAACSGDRSAIVSGASMCLR